MRHCHGHHLHRRWSLVLVDLGCLALHLAIFSSGPTVGTHGCICPDADASTKPSDLSSVPPFPPHWLADPPRTHPYSPFFATWPLTVARYPFGTCKPPSHQSSASSHKNYNAVLKTPLLSPQTTLKPFAVTPNPFSLTQPRLSQLCHTFPLTDNVSLFRASIHHPTKPHPPCWLRKG